MSRKCDGRQPLHLLPLDLGEGRRCSAPPAAQPRGARSEHLLELARGAHLARKEWTCQSHSSVAEPARGSRGAHPVRDDHLLDLLAVLVQAEGAERLPLSPTALASTTASSSSSSSSSRRRPEEKVGVQKPQLVPVCALYDRVELAAELA